MYSMHDKENAVDADEVDEMEDSVLLDDAPQDSGMLATVATIGVVGVGVAVMEAALLPGVVLGVAAVAAPKYLPRLGSAMAPLFRSAVRGVYMAGRKTREMVAEAQEQVNDIVAEVDSETDHSVDADAHAEVKKV